MIREVHIVFEVDRPAGDAYDWEALVELGQLAASQVDLGDADVMTFDHVDVVETDRG